MSISFLNCGSDLQIRLLCVRHSTVRFQYRCVYIYINMCRHINAITYPGTSVQEVCTASKGGTQIHIDCNTFDVFVSLSQSRFCGGPMY